ncbi:uncharacterized protein LOC128951978 [Oppia nitens]|uniref:uncharacterized protein LOC128951978 n=1 Tax=Oppia nitens TaxID=1686743 RepID=UPI0023DB0D71|nr:uncharacterized protein LOC128951978 [Oppia nitens]
MIMMYKSSKITYFSSILFVVIAIALTTTVEVWADDDTTATTTLATNTIVDSVADNTNTIDESPVADEEANWSHCRFENNTLIPLQSEDTHVYVTNHSRTHNRCVFIRGTIALLDIRFKATTNSPEIERGVVAKIYMPALGKYVRIPYGSLINPCQTMRDLNATNTTTTTTTTTTTGAVTVNKLNETLSPFENNNCMQTGIQNGHYYHSMGEFVVSDDFPQVQNIQVMILFRHKVADRRVSSLRKWEKHPGPLFQCIVLDNCDVI